MEQQLILWFQRSQQVSCHFRKLRHSKLCWLIRLHNRDFNTSFIHHTCISIIRSYHTFKFYHKHEILHIIIYFDHRSNDLKKQTKNSSTINSSTINHHGQRHVWRRQG